MYKDEQNLAYLLFLRPLLGEIQRVNELFESEYVDPTKLGTELISLITCLGKIIAIPTFNFNQSLNFTDYLNPKPYLDFGFEKQIEDLKKFKSVIISYANNVLAHHIAPYHFVFDNFFTGLPLLEKLSETGTIRSNRTKKCSINLVSTRKKKKEVHMSV